MKLLVRVCLLMMLGLATAPANAQQAKSEELLYRLHDRLYLANVVTGTTIALPEITATSNDQFDWTWSPNGHYLLNNVGIPETAGNRFIRIYDVENQRWLENINLESGYYDSWSSDSTQFAYTKSVIVDSYHRGQIWIFNLATGKERLLYQTVDGRPRQDPESWVSDMWWSPDDQHMLFSVFYPSTTGDRNDLFLISTAGGTPSLFPAYSPTTLFPLWSPDSKWIAFKIPQPFHPEHDFIGDLYVYSLDRDQRYTLTSTIDVDEKNARWSSDSQQIQFESGNQLVTVNLQAVVDNPESFEQKASAFTKSQPFSLWQYQSPDGQFIAFFKTNPQNLKDLYTVRTDGLELTKLVTLTDTGQFLGWRPS